MTTNDPLDSFLSAVPIKHLSRPVEKKSTCGLLFNPDGTVRARPEFIAMQKRRKQLSEDTACTFDEWSFCGFRIKKGEKSVFKTVLGEPAFTIEQVYYTGG